MVSVFVFQIDEVETNFLSEISISEFSHSQDPYETSIILCERKTEGDD